MSEAGDPVSLSERRAGLRLIVAICDTVTERLQAVIAEIADLRAHAVRAVEDLDAALRPPGEEP
jgi:hypothetical protein